MAQINVKDVPPEIKQSLKYLAAGLATSESAIIIKAIENFIVDNKEYVQYGMRIIENSPMRKE